jgi:hypothetical protein
MNNNKVISSRARHNTTQHNTTQVHTRQLLGITFGEACVLTVYIRQSGRGMRHVQQHEAVPLQAWSGPEGSRKTRFPDFMTTA